MPMGLSDLKERTIDLHKAEEVSHSGPDGVVHPVIPATWEAGKEDPKFEPSLAKTLSQKLIK